MREWASQRGWKRFRFGAVSGRPGGGGLRALNKIRYITLGRGIRLGAEIPGAESPWGAKISAAGLKSSFPLLKQGAPTEMQEHALFLSKK